MQGLKSLLSPSMLNDNNDNADPSSINKYEGEDQDQGVTTNNNTLNWLLVGVKGLEGDALQHMNVFYVLLKAWYCKKNYTAVFLTKEHYKQQVEFCKHLIGGGRWWLQVKLLGWQHGCIQVDKKVSCHDCWGRDCSSCHSTQ